MKKAFTLAEILITLGVIGVIAAITIPAVINHYRKQVTVSKLKKVYSEISQAYNRSAYDNSNDGGWAAQNDVDEISYFNTYWKPYLVNAQLCENAYSCGYDNTTNPYRFLSGTRFIYSGINTVVTNRSRILFKYGTGTIVFYPLYVYGNDPLLVSGYVNFILIDINGSEQPNVIGKDVFMFSIAEGAGLKPFGYDKTPLEINNGCKKTGSQGTYCAAKIMQDGWKINDNYPW